MNTYETAGIGNLLRDNSYPGRGIVVGASDDGKFAVAAYFIMGRSENSRNRVFVEEGESVTIYPFDPSKVEDPSLIIYSPIRKHGRRLIVTNGDQTDTVYDGLAAGKSFSRALETRRFEPDAPNFTPRISALLSFGEGSFTYEMSILKSADAGGTACNRFTYAYEPVAGIGHFLHTYRADGSPLPTFAGEPERVAIPSDIDGFSKLLWDNIDPANKISLYVRFTSLADGRTMNRLFNKNSR